MPDFAMSLCVAPPPGFGVSKECLASALAEVTPLTEAKAEWESDGHTEWVRVTGMLSVPDVFAGALVVGKALPGALVKCHIAPDAPVIELTLKPPHSAGGSPPA